MSTEDTTATSNGGRVQDKFDPRDHYYVANPSTQVSKTVNLRQDNMQLVSDIYNQQGTNSCTANATAAALWYEEKTGHREVIWGKGGPSRLFIYWLARCAYEDNNLNILSPSDEGSCTRDAMKSIAKCGACSEDDWPFDLTKINIKPSEKSISNAAPQKIRAFYRLDPDRPDENDQKLNDKQKDKIGAALLENLKRCLAEQYPVVIGFWYYLPPQYSFDETQKPFVLKDVWSLPNMKFPRHTFTEDLDPSLRIKDAEGQAISIGHTVLAIGYDDDRQQILVQNSYGPGWSKGGVFWMPYSWITDYAASNDFWTIRNSPIESAKRWEEIHRDILGPNFAT